MLGRLGASSQICARCRHASGSAGLVPTWTAWRANAVCFEPALAWRAFTPSGAAYESAARPGRRRFRDANATGQAVQVNCDSGLPIRRVAAAAFTVTDTPGSRQQPRSEGTLIEIRGCDCCLSRLRLRGTAGSSAAAASPAGVLASTKPRSTRPRRGSFVAPAVRTRPSRARKAIFCGVQAMRGGDRGASAAVSSRTFAAYASGRPPVPSKRGRTQSSDLPAPKPGAVSPYGLLSDTEITLQCRLSQERDKGARLAVSLSIPVCACVCDVPRGRVGCPRACRSADSPAQPGHRAGNLACFSWLRNSCCLAWPSGRSNIPPRFVRRFRAGRVTSRPSGAGRITGRVLAPGERAQRLGGQVQRSAIARACAPPALPSLAARRLGANVEPSPLFRAD